MKKIKKLSSLVLIFTLLLSTTALVHAADPYLNYGSKSGKITVKNYSNSYNSKWVSIINNARSAWNSSKAKVSISTSKSSKNKVEAAKFNDSWYGLCSQSYNTSTGYTTKFTIKVNARTISKDAKNFNSFAKSTVAHEFGHVFWLCDNPSTKSSSLMKYSRNRNRLTTPQSFDIKNVNKKY